MLISILLPVLTLLNPVISKPSFGLKNISDPVTVYTPFASEIIVIKDLNANTKPYAYFSLETGKDVTADEAKTTKWDLAFSKTTIAVNGGTSGPGQGAAQVLEQPFEMIKNAPKDGYKMDGEAGNAIPGGSGNSWYKYDMSVHAILPIVGRTIVVKTAEGKFAKIEIISYYKGAPEDVPTEESSYFTFRYVLADENGKF
ncbi:HmuY family protein [Dyadobacter sp. NIV53]|uniref:HmuY family protein n=1 Tax=Dyadobacter sp. NIV53 TaxID=2861765 RepID=UPI001C88A0C2|nr:HmuY family protein [Dyadobacter sp. NIV53]